MGYKVLTVKSGKEALEIYEENKEQPDIVLLDMIMSDMSGSERREFKLAIDPHKCAFGKWYDNFETDNRTLSGCLKKCDAPHQEIHGIAIKVKGMEEKEDFDSAYEIINPTKEGERAEMIRLFSRLAPFLENQNVKLLWSWNGKCTTIAARQ